MTKGKSKKILVVSKNVNWIGRFAVCVYLDVCTSLAIQLPREQGLWWQS